MVLAAFSPIGVQDWFGSCYDKSCLFRMPSPCLPCPTAHQAHARLVPELPAKSLDLLSIARQVVSPKPSSHAGNTTSVRLCPWPEAHTISDNCSQEMAAVCLDPDFSAQGTQLADPRLSPVCLPPWFFVSTVTCHLQNIHQVVLVGSPPWPRATFH